MAMVQYRTETAIVQQVSKASSDQLLRKFADPDDSDSDTATKPSRTPKRRRIRRRNAEGDNSDGFAERKSLLTQPTTARPRSAVLRRLGITRSQIIRARDVKNRSVLGSIQKTWSKAVRGASRVFIEKHYNSHRRLTSDIV